jgi:hypothetical protein
MELPSTLVDAWRVLRLLPQIESLRRAQGPQQAISAVRLLGQKTAPRNEQSRRCLRRAIHWVDCSLADGGNCYRRALLEMALDGAAASQPFIMGFKTNPRHVAGHAWLSPATSSAERYDFELQL